MAAPYALSSDLVSAWPAKSLEVAQYIDGQVPLLAMTQNPQTGTTYTFVAADFTKLVTLSNASPVTVTLPLEATVPWPTGTQLRLLNQGAGLVTVAGAVGVTINGTPLTLAQYKGAILTKTGTNIWTFLPFSGGSAPAVISSTTGSPTITTDAGATVYKFTGDGTIVVGTAGAVQVLVLAGGAAGGNNAGGGGGAGAIVVQSSIVLAAGTHTIKVGAGGAIGAADRAGLSGGYSQVGAALSIGGGGGGGALAQNGVAGGSGGGTSDTAAIAGAGISQVGFAGGTGATGAGAGGGGGSAAGSNGTASVGGAGGNGATSDILVSGTPVTYAGGGGGARNSGSPGAGGTGGGGTGGTSSSINGTAGSANTGGGGGGGTTNQVGSPGGSGMVVVRVG